MFEYEAGAFDFLCIGQYLATNLNCLAIRSLMNNDREYQNVAARVQ